MPLDTSIPLQAKAPESNPLATLLQVGQYKYLQQNSNKLQRDMDANQAVGQAIQRNTRPDGSVDQNALMADLSRDPSAAQNLQQTLGTSLAQQGQQTANGTAHIQQQGAQLKLSQEQNAQLVQQTSSALANPNLSYTDVVKMAIDNGKAFGVPDNVIQQVVANLPTDQAGLRRTLQAKLAALQGPSQQLDTMTPGAGSVGTGGGTTMFNRDKLDGSITPTAIFQNTVSPDAAAQQVKVIGADGTMSQVPMASVLKQQGMGSVLPPQAQPQAGASAPGRYPGNSGAFQVSPPAGVAEAAQKANAAGGDMLAADQQSNSQSGTRINTLQNASDALAKAQTGTGADKLNAVRGVVAMLGGPADKVASYDEANKYLTQYAQQKAASFGHSTDAQLSAALTGNGNTHISNLAAQDVVKVNLGLERMEQARMQAWQNSNLDPSKYAAWKSQFGATMDPRVFVADQLDPTKVKKMYSGMKPAEQQQFRTQYNWAVQNGYINGPK